MLFNERTYSVLVVSSSDKLNTALRSLLSESQCSPIRFTASVASANRELLEKTYDFVIVNSPLPDDTGVKLAIDVCSGRSTVCVLLVRAEQHEEIQARVINHGVFTLLKPITGSTMNQALRWMASARERLRRMEKKTMSIEEKMEEIRLVNRAKWVLIDNLKMTEPDAHRYIEKQAMDLCVTRREVAEDIIKTYN